MCTAQRLQPLAAIMVGGILAGCGGSGGSGGAASPYTVVFEHGTSGTLSSFDIYAMDGNGGHVRNLTNTPGFDAFPSVDLAGDIVFETDRDGPLKVYKMAADGSGQTSLSQDDAYTPRFSPDGTKIVYVVGSLQGDIWIMNSDGSGQTQLTSAADDEQRPSFTPDGSHILFESNASGKYQLYSMDVNGGNVTRLTNSGGDDYEPVASPDGTKIVFVRSNATEEDLYTMDIGGGNEALLTSGPSDDIEPDFSPDGTKIYFSSAPVANGNYSIRRINADGTGNRLIHSGADNYRPSVWQAVP